METSATPILMEYLFVHNIRPLSRPGQNADVNPCPPEILSRKQEGRILGQWSNPVSGSRKSQASSTWAKQHIVKPVPSWRNHMYECPRILLVCFRARSSGALSLSRLRRRNGWRDEFGAAYIWPFCQWPPLNSKEFFRGAHLTPHRGRLSNRALYGK